MPGIHQLTDQTNFLPIRQVITVFLGLSVALACAYLDQTVVATALPRISSDLHSGRLSSWVATAYLLTRYLPYILRMNVLRQQANQPTSLAFTPLYGRWSDIFGRKAVLIFSLSVFFVSSLACALAQTMIQVCLTYSAAFEQNSNIFLSLSYFERSKALAEAVRAACAFSSMYYQLTL